MAKKTDHSDKFVYQPTDRLDVKLPKTRPGKLIGKKPAGKTKSK